MKQTTQCYLERGSQYLMLHRTKKQNDENHDKWIGVGGKFEPGESPEACARREVLEETGYSVTPMRMSGIYERVSDGREEGLCHKIYYIFLCRLDSPKTVTPMEIDRFQIGSEWVPLREVAMRNLFPRAIRDNISAFIGYGETYYIGSERER